MIITTGDHPASETVTRAEQLAGVTGVRYIPRNRTSLAKMSHRAGDSDILVVLEGGARLYRQEADDMIFHPSMSFVRAKRILRGERDPMLDAAEISPGDTVVDCTAGLGSDSAIFSLGTGALGSVIAVEDSLPLWSLLHEGFANYVSGVKEFDEALRRIRLKRCDHLEALKNMPDKSADIVYFDPMFRDPVSESSAISPLRAYANNGRLTEAAVAEACRVARRSVMLKEKKDSGEFERLGFRICPRSQAKIVYGVIKIDNQG